MTVLGALVGPARSGTTWAGTIIDSCPDVIYRFEPFHRMAAADPEIREWFDRLKRREVTHSDIPRLYEILRLAHPLTNKAPFFPYKAYQLRRFGRSQMWPLARVLRPLRWIYGRAYTPNAGPPLIFKEVTFVRPVQNLVSDAAIPIVYLVRHPCATVLSEVRGQANGRLSRQQRLRELLLEQSPWLIEQFPEVVAGKDVVSRTALLWRSEVETCAAEVRASATGMVLTYEELADDAHLHARRMFAHLGIEFGDQTLEFLDRLYCLSSNRALGPRRTGWGKKYFSVYRNPRVEKDSWTRRISNDDRRKVESIVQGSPVIEACAVKGRWW